MSYLMVSKKKNPLFMCECDSENLSLSHTLMSNDDPQDGFFYPTLTLTTDSYNL